jgi:hypothetical protein
MANDFIGPHPNALGIANGLLLISLIKALRANLIITRDDTAAIFADALESIEPDSTVISEQQAIAILKKLADHFKIDSA